jgi:hypothetical protein
VLQQASMFMIQAAMQQVRQLTDLIAAVTPGAATGARTGSALNAVG